MIACVENISNVTRATHRRACARGATASVCGSRCARVVRSRRTRADARAERARVGDGNDARTRGPRGGAGE